MTLITKLKYVGVSEEDLLHIYILYIQSLLEYVLLSGVALDPNCAPGYGNCTKVVSKVEFWC